MPRAVALDPLLGTEDPVLLLAGARADEVVQHAEELGGPDAAWLRRDLHVERPIVDQVDGADPGPQILLDSATLAASS